jgi:Ser/Thr protein kinase RdoA (MazF antagonist)
MHLSAGQAIGGKEKMEKEIRALLNEEILNEAAGRFGVNISEVKLIGGFQNFIYEYRKQEKSYILRLTHSSHRSENLIKGELDFILYLSENGVSASKPIYSQYSRLTEKIDACEYSFIAASFEKAIGEKIDYPECLNNDELFVKCGQITGRIHALSKKYKPSVEEIQRHDWTQNYYLQNMKRFIPEDQYKVYESCKRLMGKIKNLNKSTDSYGLIHGDINVGNFFMNDEGITVFDFDECQYSWFVEDIAIQLFYIVYVFLDDSRDERQAQAYRFMKNFMKGYCQENFIDEYWLEQIPLFMQLREIIVHIGIYRSFDLDNLNQWMQGYFMQSRSRIEQGIPIVDEIRF